MVTGQPHQTKDKKQIYVKCNILHIKQYEQKMKDGTLGEGERSHDNCCAEFLWAEGCFCHLKA